MLFDQSFIQLPENEKHDYLLELYKSNTVLDEENKSFLLNLETSSYSLLGIIGLLTNEKARVLLGKKQTYHKVIHDLCYNYKITRSDLEEIADWDINKEMTELEDYIHTRVMLEYPPK